MLTHCGNNVRNRYSGCVFSVKDIVPVPLKTSRNRFGTGKRHKGFPHRFKTTINVVDATTIKLVAQCMDWAKHRRRKAAAKCHMRLDLQSLLPRFAIIDTAKENDAKRARELCGGLRAGEIVLFDKAYVDFSHLHEMTQRGVYFVSRAKDNLAYRCVKRLQKKPQGKILRDDLIVLKTPASRQDYPLRLRRVEALVEVKGKEVVMVFLIAPGSIPRSLLRTFNFEIWKLKCLGACPEDLYPTTSQGLRAVCVSFTAAAGASRPFSARSNKPLTCVIFSVTAPTPCAGRYGRPYCSMC